MLTSGIRLVGLFRTAVFQVWLVPWIAVAILWGCQLQLRDTDPLSVGTLGRCLVP